LEQFYRQCCALMAPKRVVCLLVLLPLGGTAAVADHGSQRAHADDREGNLQCDEVNFLQLEGEKVKLALATCHPPTGSIPPPSSEAIPEWALELIPALTPEPTPEPEPEQAPDQISPPSPDAIPEWALEPMPLPFPEAIPEWALELMPPPSYEAIPEWALEPIPAPAPEPTPEPEALPATICTFVQDSYAKCIPMGHLTADASLDACLGRCSAWATCKGATFFPQGDQFWGDLGHHCYLLAGGCSRFPFKHSSTYWKMLGSCKTATHHRISGGSDGDMKSTVSRQTIIPDDDKKDEKRRNAGGTGLESETTEKRGAGNDSKAKPSEAIKIG